MHNSQFTLPEGVHLPDPTKTRISSRKRVSHEQIFPSDEEWIYFYLWRSAYRWIVHDVQKILLNIMV